MSLEFVIYNSERMVKGWPDKIEAAQLQATYVIGGKEYPRVRYGQEQSDWGADRHGCLECRVFKGQFHVVGCGAEECPICHGQILICVCLCDEGKDAA